jgi:hypothetical protein
MIVESVAGGGALVIGSRLVLPRARVLAEHGVTCAEDERRFDEVVRLLGGSIRRARAGRDQVVWDVERTLLEGSLRAAPHNDAAEEAASA